MAGYFVLYITLIELQNLLQPIVRYAGLFIVICIYKST